MGNADGSAGSMGTRSRAGVHGGFCSPAAVSRYPGPTTTVVLPDKSLMSALFLFACRWFPAVSTRLIDARGRVSTHGFRPSRPLAGLTALGGRLAAYPGAFAVAEPTSVTWLGRSIAVGEVGGQFALISSRRATRL